MSQLSSMEHPVHSWYAEAKTRPGARPGPDSALYPSDVDAPGAGSAADPRRQGGDLELDRLRYLVLPPKWPAAGLETAYDLTYRFWKEVWSRTFLELDGEDELFSDDFIRQDEIAVVFHGDEPIAMTLLNFMDLRTQSHRESSCFRAFDIDLFPKVVSEFSWNALVCCYFTVSPKWRLGSAGFSMKELLAEVVIHHFLSSRAQILIGTARRDKGVHELLYSRGGIPLRQNIIFHNVPVDIIVIPKQSATFCGSAMIRDLGRRIWDRRIRAR